MSELDARNLLCPMPVIRTQSAVNKSQTGDKLTVYCTDPGTVHDIPTWCRINGHKVLEQKEHDGEIIFVIEVGG